jgi:hypothetical protein
MDREMLLLLGLFVNDEDDRFYFQILFNGHITKCEYQVPKSKVKKITVSDLSKFISFTESSIMIECRIIPQREPKIIGVTVTAINNEAIQIEG